MMVNETNVKCFLSLVETLNFTKTAEDIFMTQQAVSQNISKLEASLGVPLFERDRHNVNLTAAGQQFYTLFTRFRVEYEFALKEVQSNKDSLMHALNVGYQSWLDFGPPLTYAQTVLHQRYPDLYLGGERHSPMILTEQLRSKKLDAIIVYDHFVPTIPGLKHRVIHRTPAVLMVSFAHHLVTPDATWETFRREPFIFDFLENEKPATVNKRLQQAIDHWDLKPQQVIIRPNRDSAFTTAELGQGIIITSEMNRITHSSTLKGYLLGKDEIITCCWWENPDNPMIEDYVDLLVKAYAETAQVIRQA